MRAKDFIIESVIWNTNVDDMLPSTQFYAKKGVLVRANIHELFQKTPRKVRLDPNDPTGGKNKIGDRVANAIQHWKQDGVMDPPVISILNGQVNFIDGRHRLVAAAQMGETEAPVIIAPANRIKQAREILKLSKWN